MSTESRELNIGTGLDRFRGGVCQTHCKRTRLRVSRRHVTTEYISHGSKASLSVFPVGNRTGAFSSLKPIDGKDSDEPYRLPSLSRTNIMDPKHEKPWVRKVLV